MNKNNVRGAFRFGPAAALLAIVVSAGAGGATTITPSSLREAAVAAVNAELGGMGDIEIAGGNIAVPEEIEGEDLEIRTVRVSSEGRGPVHVTLDLFRDGARSSRRVISFDVRIYRDILVAAEQVRRHDELADESVIYERRDIRAFTGEPISDIATIEGKRAKRLIREGEPLLAAMVEEIPVISRGEKVLLMVSVGGVSITATGTALEDGAPGEAINVKNDRSGKRLRCSVISAGVVSVSLAGATVNGG